MAAREGKPSTGKNQSCVTLVTNSYTVYSLVYFQYT